jgi:hypothetical protein
MPKLMIGIARTNCTNKKGYVENVLFLRIVKEIGEIVDEASMTKHKIDRMESINAFEEQKRIQERILLSLRVLK